MTKYLVEIQDAPWSEWRAVRGQAIYRTHAEAMRTVNKIAPAIGHRDAGLRISEVNV